MAQIFQKEKKMQIYRNRLISSEIENIDELGKLFDYQTPGINDDFTRIGIMMII